MKHKNIKYGMLIALLLIVTCLFSPCKVTAGTNNPILNGWYMVVSGNNDDYVLDIHEDSRSNGGNVEIYAKKNYRNQRFYFKYLNNGYYSIKVHNAKKYIHISDENNSICNVHQWSGYSNKNAQWKIIDAGNGYYYFQNRGNGSYLDNSNGNIRNGNNVIAYPFNGSSAQKWRFLSTNSSSSEKKSVKEGWYLLESGSGKDYVVTVHGNGENNGTNVEIDNNRYKENQFFYLEYTGDGYYTMKAGHSSKYIHAASGNKTPGNVHQWDDHSSYNCQWCFEPAGNNYYYIRCRNGNYLDNSNNIATSGNNVITYNFNKTNAQKWRLLKPSNNDEFASKYNIQYKTVTKTYNFKTFDEWKKQVLKSNTGIVLGGGTTTLSNGQTIATKYIIYDVEILKYKKIAAQLPLIQGPNAPLKTVYLNLPSRVRYTLHKHKLRMHGNAATIGKLIAGLVEQKLDLYQTCDCGLSVELSWEIPDLVGQYNQMTQYQEYTVGVTRYTTSTY